MPAFPAGRQGVKVASNQQVTNGTLPFTQITGRNWADSVVRKVPLVFNLLKINEAGDPRKRERAQQVFEQYLREGRLVISTQVVQEFHAVGVRKLGLPHAFVRTRTLDLLDLPLVYIDPMHIRRALQNEEAFQISFWDALILAAAEDAKAEVLFTEDLNHGQQYGAVRVENPFLE
jgi:predicted nucleic acid-binding protein